MRKEAFGILSPRGTKIIVVLYGSHLFLKRKIVWATVTFSSYLRVKTQKDMSLAVCTCRLVTLRY